MIRRILAAVVALALIAAPIPVPAATGTHAPAVAVQYLNNSGSVCNGCKLFTYAPGTTTKKTTYSDVSLSSSNTNPIVLDSAGRATIFLTPGESYKFVLAPSTDTDPPTSAYWTRDNISAIAPAGSATDNDVSGTAGETLTAGEVVYLSDGSGGTTAGRWYLADSDATYSSNAAAMIGAATTAAAAGEAVTVRLSGRVTGLAGLVAGSVYYVAASAGALTATAPSNARAVGIADSTTTLVIGPWAPYGGSAIVYAGNLTVSGTTALNGSITLGDAAADIVTPTATVQGPFGFRPGSASSGTAYMSGRYHTDTTTTGNVGTGEDTLATVTLPANAVNSNGKIIRVTAWGSFAGNANNKRIRLKLGSTTLYDSTAAAWNDATYGFWYFVGTIARTGAAAQKSVGFLHTVQEPSAAYWRIDPGTGTEDWTTALALTITGEATSNNDVLIEGFIVEVIG